MYEESIIICRELDMIIICRELDMFLELVIDALLSVPTKAECKVDRCGPPAGSVLKDCAQNNCRSATSHVVSAPSPSQHCSQSSFPRNQTEYSGTYWSQLSCQLFFGWRENSRVICYRYAKICLRKTVPLMATKSRKKTICSIWTDMNRRPWMRIRVGLFWVSGGSKAVPKVIRVGLLWGFNLL